jgi:hypothetical protein
MGCVTELETGFKVGYDHMSPLKLEGGVAGDGICLFNDHFNCIVGAKGGN